MIELTLRDVLTLAALGVILFVLFRRALHPPTPPVPPRPDRDPVIGTDVHRDERRRQLARLTGQAPKGWDAHRTDRVAGVINPPKGKPS